MQDVFSTLTRVVGQFAAAPEAKEPLVFAAWRRTSGSLISESAVPLRFVDSTLEIAVRDKNWQRQLAAHASEYLFKMNSLLSEISVDRVEFVIRSDAFGTAETNGNVPLEAADHPPAAIASAADSIRDSGLRDQFLRAAGAAATRFPVK